MLADIIKGKCQYTNTNILPLLESSDMPAMRSLKKIALQMLPFLEY